MSAVEVKWKFNPDFKDIFLDLWYEKSPESFNQAFKACDEYGNEMIRWLKFMRSKFHDKIYEQTLKEMRLEE